MKYCINTFIFNDYEPVREVEEIDENCDYYLFTDNPNTKSNTWKVIYIPELDNDEYIGIQKTLKFKYTFYKYIPNVDQYEYLIQLDASLLIKNSLAPILNYMKKYKYDIIVGIHPDRDCFIDEYHAWINERGLDPVYYDIFLKVIGDYDLNTKGLIMTTAKFYRNCKETLNFIDDVNAILETSCESKDKNDQCYFTYILSKHLDKMRISYCDIELIVYSEYMVWFMHGSLDTYYMANASPNAGKYIPFLGKYIRLTPKEEYK